METRRLREEEKKKKREEEERRKMEQIETDRRLAVSGGERMSVHAYTCCIRCTCTCTCCI